MEPSRPPGWKELQTTLLNRAGKLSVKQVRNELQTLNLNTEGTAKVRRFTQSASLCLHLLNSILNLPYTGDLSTYDRVECVRNLCHNHLSTTKPSNLD